MSNDKMRDESREKFEVEYASYAGITLQEVAGEWDGDLYGDQGMRDAWWAWQASREALLIDLPEGQSLFQRMYGVSCQRPLLIERKQAVNAIESAGLKVKP